MGQVQSVTVNGVPSSWRLVGSRIPQGSSLYCLLDLNVELEDVLSKFADVECRGASGVIQADKRAGQSLVVFSLTRAILDAVPGREQPWLNIQHRGWDAAEGAGGLGQQ